MMEAMTLNPLMSNGAFNICCPRDCVSRTVSPGMMGAPRVPPLNPSESIVLSKHYLL